MQKANAFRLRVLPPNASISDSSQSERPSPRLSACAASAGGYDLPNHAEHPDFQQLGDGDGAETEFPANEPGSQVYFTRDQRRSRRKREIRPRTINMSRFAQSALEVGRALHPESEVERPLTRQDCADVPRPCPFVSCRHHLYLDVSPRTGSIKLNFPDLEVEELRESCSLDVAEQGPLGAEELGAVMNLTRERVRQLEQRGLTTAWSKLETVESLPPPAHTESGKRGDRARWLRRF